MVYVVGAIYGSADAETDGALAGAGLTSDLRVMRAKQGPPYGPPSGPSDAWSWSRSRRVDPGVDRGADRRLPAGVARREEAVPSPLRTDEVPDDRVGIAREVVAKRRD
jgi:hypothetical protein